MSDTFKNTGFFRSFSKLFQKISSSGIFGIQPNILVFKPEKEITIHTYKSSKGIDKEKHYHRSNTHPVAEKQSLSKEKKKVKDSE